MTLEEKRQLRLLLEKLRKDQIEYISDKQGIPVEILNDMEPEELYDLDDYSSVLQSVDNLLYEL